MIAVTVPTIAAALHQEGANDAAATAGFIAAYHRQAVEGRIASRRATRALEKTVRDTKRRCPGVLAGAPRTAPAFADVEEAVIDALELEAIQVDSSEVKRFAAPVRALRWTSHPLTVRVHAFAAEIAQPADASAAAPDLCTTMREWAASHFGAPPAALVRFTAAFDREVQTPKAKPEAGRETRIFRELAPFERPRQRAELRAARRLIGRTASESIGSLYRAKLAEFRALGSMPLVY